MVTLSNQLNTLSIGEVQDIATGLTCTLNRDMLVHILLDMVDPRVMIENILKTKEDNDSLAKTMEEKKFPPLVPCIDCVDIYHKLELELKLYGVYETEDYAYTYSDDDRIENNK